MYTDCASFISNKMICCLFFKKELNRDKLKRIIQKELPYGVCVRVYLKRFHKISAIGMYPVCL